MNVVDISVFFDEAATRLSGAPLETIKQELRGTLREFYVRSGSWVVESSGKTIRANKRDYNFEPQQTGNVLAVYACKVDGRPVGFSGTREPGAIQLTIAYSEDKPKALVATLSLKPSSYNLIPEETVTYDFDAILDGLTGRMFMMPDRPWSNSPQAPYYLKRFRIGQAQARERIRKLYTKNNLSYRFPPW